MIARTPSTAPDETFFGQQTITGKLVLTASNGFFNPATQAKPGWLQGDQAHENLFKLPATIGPARSPRSAGPRQRSWFPFPALI